MNNGMKKQQMEKENDGSDEERKNKTTDDRKNGNKRRVKGKVIVSNSADGACYIDKVTSSESNIVSFNAQLWAKSLKHEFTTSNSLNIITYLQIHSDERIEYVEEEFIEFVNTSLS